VAVGIWQTKSRPRSPGLWWRQCWRRRGRWRHRRSRHRGRVPIL